MKINYNLTPLIFYSSINVSVILLIIVLLIQIKQVNNDVNRVHIRYAWLHTHLLLYTNSDTPCTSTV